MTTTPPPSAAPTGLEATQTRRPWRATLRTVLAVGIPGLLLLPTIFEILVEELGGTLPPRATEWLLIAGAFVTAVAGVITRILALPQVELLLRRLPAAAFAAQPRPKPVDGDHRGEAGRTTVEWIVLVLILAAAVWVVLALLSWALGGPR